jgi:hypothetical protein
LDWNDPDNWSPVGVPGVGSDVTIATGRAVVSSLIAMPVWEREGLQFAATSPIIITVAW